MGFENKQQQQQSVVLLSLLCQPSLALLFYPLSFHFHFIALFLCPLSISLLTLSHLSPSPYPRISPSKHDDKNKVNKKKSLQRHHEDNAAEPFAFHLSPFVIVTCISSILSLVPELPISSDTTTKPCGTWPQPFTPAQANNDKATGRDLPASLS